MVVERTSPSKLTEGLSDSKPEPSLLSLQRKRYYQLWADLEASPFLSLRDQVDRAVEVRWLELSLGFVTQKEHRVGLNQLLDEIEANKDNNNEAKEASEYIFGEAQVTNGKPIPRPIEIRRRVMTDEQYEDISRRMRYLG